MDATPATSARTGDCRFVTVTPAGRRRYMEILANYLLRNRHVIDEHQWWVNTREPEDVAFLLRLVDQYPDFFRVVTQPMHGAEEIGYSIWRFMRQATDPRTIYLRLDDDVCFVAEGAIAAMRGARLARREPFLMLGNIVNNAICTHLHQQAGLVPTKWGLVAEDCLCPIGWRSSAFAAKLHRRFLKDATAGKLDRWRELPMEFDGLRRFSINAICWFGADMASLPESGRTGVDEEPFLTEEVPRRLNRPNAIVPEALFGHFAFCYQRRDLEAIAPEILHRYQRISRHADAASCYELSAAESVRFGLTKASARVRLGYRRALAAAKGLRPTGGKRRAA
ncbi:MAG: hypothetical protein KF688_12080 [Pirellulales bacterium]|nr:hypothetical protein [Pirellulales bacterium]